MASVVQDRQLAESIEHCLSRLTDEWEGVPALAAEWDDWDEHSQLVFILDWPIQEDQLRRLQHWAKEDRLTDEQRKRFDALLRLIACHRPMLERLIAD